jgi:hypothetical protein
MHQNWSLFTNCSKMRITAWPFKGRPKRLKADKLKRLKELNGLEQLLEIIQILELLAASSVVQILNHNMKSKAFLLKDKLRMGDIYAYIDAEYHHQIDINILQKNGPDNIRPCRYFKRQTEMTLPTLSTNTG